MCVIVTAFCRAWCKKQAVAAPIQFYGSRPLVEVQLDSVSSPLVPLVCLGCFFESEPSHQSAHDADGDHDSWRWSALAGVVLVTVLPCCILFLC